MDNARAALPVARRRSIGWRARDKAQALRALLEVTDFKALLEASGYPATLVGGGRRFRIPLAGVWLLWQGRPRAGFHSSPYLSNL
jgi:hypothetical protein